MSWYKAGLVMPRAKLASPGLATFVSVQPGRLRSRPLIAESPWRGWTAAGLDSGRTAPALPGKSGAVWHQKRYSQRTAQPGSPHPFLPFSPPRGSCRRRRGSSSSSGGGRTRGAVAGRSRRRGPAAAGRAAPVGGRGWSLPGRRERL